MALFAVSAGICFWARTSGTLILIGPGALYDKYRDLATHEFKQNFLKCAGSTGTGAFGPFPNAFFSFGGGPIDGTRLPILVVDDLGTVTVYGDGSEEYQGQLSRTDKGKKKN